jgi:hypothetical protein
MCSSVKAGTNRRIGVPGNAENGIGEWKNRRPPPISPFLRFAHSFFVVSVFPHRRFADSFGLKPAFLRNFPCSVIIAQQNCSLDENDVCLGLLSLPRRGEGTFLSYRQPPKKAG